MTRTAQNTQTRAMEASKNQSETLEASKNQSETLKSTELLELINHMQEKIHSLEQKQIHPLVDAKPTRHRVETNKPDNYYGKRNAKELDAWIFTVENYCRFAG